MNYAALLGSALWALRRNKMRSLLTVLGITIGIAAVICVVAIGNVEIMDVLQHLNDKGLTIVMVTHEPDIAHFAKRVIVFRDGTIRKDDLVENRPRARDVLDTMPALED